MSNNGYNYYYYNSGYPQTGTGQPIPMYPAGATYPAQSGGPTGAQQAYYGQGGTAAARKSFISCKVDARIVPRLPSEPRIPTTAHCHSISRPESSKLSGANRRFLFIRPNRPEHSSDPRSSRDSGRSRDPKRSINAAVRLDNQLGWTVNLRGQRRI